MSGVKSWIGQRYLWMQLLLALRSAVKALIVFVPKAECTRIWCHSGIMAIFLVAQVMSFHDLHLVKFRAVLWWNGNLPSIEPCPPLRHLESLLVPMCLSAAVWADKDVHRCMGVWWLWKYPVKGRIEFYCNLLHTFLKEKPIELQCGIFMHFADKLVLQSSSVMRLSWM